MNGLHSVGEDSFSSCDSCAIYMLCVKINKLPFPQENKGCVLDISFPQLNILKKNQKQKHH